MTFQQKILPINQSEQNETVAQERRKNVKKKGTIEQLNLHVDETKWLTSFFVFFLKRLKIVIKICVCEEDISWLCLLKDFNLFTEII